MKKMNEKEDGNWDNATHRKWADERKHGVTHFGYDHVSFLFLFFDISQSYLNMTRQIISFFKRIH